MAISNDIKLWQEEAEKQAKKYSDEIKANNQYLIDQLNQSKQNTLEQLQSQQDNAIYNLNTNKSTINQNAVDNAKQANINRLLALRSNEHSLNRAGLGTQGIVGSQNASINNNYGQNLTSILNQKTNDLRELEKEKNDTLLKYNENKLNLSNEYDSNLANLQSAIDDKALQQYNTVYQNYLAMKQQEWENEQRRLAEEEAKRQWEEKLKYQREQDAIANDQRWAEINATNSNPFDFGDNNNNNNEFNNSNETNNTTDSLGNSQSTIKKSDYYFNGTDQPRYIEDTKLTNTKVTAGDLGITSDGIGSGYRIWSANGKYYVWNNNLKTYFDVTDEYASAKTSTSQKSSLLQRAMDAANGDYYF